MNKLAIDIVLLPSKEITEAAYRFNRELLRRTEGKIVLDQNHSLPHLSLAMGAMKEEDIPAAADILEGIASHFPPIDLVFTEIDAGPLATGITLFDIYRGPQIGDNRKSLAFRVTFTAPDRALTDAELGKVRDRIARTLRQRVAGELRT